MKEKILTAAISAFMLISLIFVFQVASVSAPGSAGAPGTVPLEIPIASVVVLVVAFLMLAYTMRRMTLKKHVLRYREVKKNLKEE